MKIKQSRSIGVVTSYNAKYIYFLDMINGIMAAARDNGFSVTICDNNQDTGMPNYVQYFLENRIDGVIFVSSAHSEESSHEKNYIELFKKYAIPYVVIYGYTSDKDTSYVNMDFFQNSYDACKCLYELGCSDVVYVAPMDVTNSERYLPRTERDRINGYIEALSLVGKKESDKNILFLPRDFKKNDYSAICELFGSKRNFDGVVTCWATYGMQVLNVAKDLDVRIPDDIRVIALDTLPYLQFTNPGLSSMRLPFFEIAQKGAELLIAKLLGENNEIIKLNIPCELILRQST